MELLSLTEWIDHTNKKNKRAKKETLKWIKKQSTNQKLRGRNCYKKQIRRLLRAT